MEPKVKKQIESADWASIIRDLAVYTVYRVEKVFYKAKGDCVLPMGFSIGSIVQEAIVKLLNGTRKWDPDKVDLLCFLKGIVKSDTSHLVELKESVLTDRTQILEERLDIQDQNPSSEQVFDENEERNLLITVHKKLIQQAESNPEYESVALCIMDGVVKSAEIAMETGISIDKVYSLKKRWKKDYEKILREVFAEAN